MTLLHQRTQLRPISGTQSGSALMNTFVFTDDMSSPTIEQVVSAQSLQVELGYITERLDSQLSGNPLAFLEALGVLAVGQRVRDA